MTVRFGTKAETLARLASRLSTARVLPQVRFTVAGWRRDPGRLLARLARRRWLAVPLIVRSSARVEDRAGASLAGRFLSVAGVCGRDAVATAVDRVIVSYGKDADAAGRARIPICLAAAECSA